MRVYKFQQSATSPKKWRIEVDIDELDSIIKALRVKKVLDDRIKELEEKVNEIKNNHLKENDDYSKGY